MSKLLFFALIFTVFASAQETQIIRVGTNPKIVIAGAYDYDKTPKFSGTFSWVTRFDSENEFGIAVEYTELTPYYFSYGFVYNHHIDIFYSNFIETKAGIEVFAIQRGKAYQGAEQLFGSAGLNAILIFNISEMIQAGLRANLKYRPDDIKLWNGQKTSYGGFFEIGIKFY